MKELFCIFFLSSLWLSFSGYVNKVFIKFFKNDFKTQKTMFLSLSVGFIFSFLVIADLSLLRHFFGISIPFPKSIIPLPFIIIFINRQNIKNFCNELFLVFSQLRKSLISSLIKKDKLIISLFIVVIFQTICLSIRFVLPLTHGDAIGQYFYDSLQISRLQDINLLEYYEMGERFRSDSLASFFDAEFIQLTNNWFLVRFARFLSLFLVVFSSIEMAFNLGFINFKKSLLLICIILTLPDVWSVFISGKHDGYVFLFEFTGTYIVFLSILCKEKIFKVVLAVYSVFIGFMSVSIRLSSLSFLFLSFILLIYYLFKFREYFFSFKYKQFISFIPFFQISFLLITLLLSLMIFVINYKYFSNPFFKISPPSFLSKVFTDAIYELNYDEIKETLSLRHIPLIFKPISTFIYTSLGIEPIRLILSKLKDQNYILLKLFETINFFGPKDMMVSILSFSPFCLLPFFEYNSLSKNKKFILAFSTLWLFLWTLSIPYSRTAIASSLSLIVLAFSSPISFSNYSFKSFIGFLKITLFSYGILTVYLFTFWSFSNLYDLPINNLISSKKYSRTSLTRDYIKLQNDTLGNKNIIPNINFENSWKQIEDDNPNKILFLKAPTQFSYFMNKGLIIRDKTNLLIKKTDKSLCFVLDSSQELIRNGC